MKLRAGAYAVLSDLAHLVPGGFKEQMKALVPGIQLALGVGAISVFLLICDISAGKSHQCRSESFLSQFPQHSLLHTRPRCNPASFEDHFAPCEQMHQGQQVNAFILSTLKTI